MNCLDDYQLGEQVDGRPEANVGVIVFERGFSFSECISIRFRVRGTLSFRARQKIAQLGISLPRAVAQLRMSLWNPNTSVCTVDSRVGLSSLKYKQTGSSPIGDEPFG